jgi:hypothetical protein
MRKDNQYVGWIGIIALLLLPPFLVRSDGNDSAVRLAFYFILALSAIGFFSYFLFSKTPLIQGSVFEKKFGEPGKRNAESLIRILCALAAIGGIWMILSILPSVITYNSTSSPIIEAHKITHIVSAAVPGAFYIHMGISTEDGKHLSYWYPSEVLQAGSEYSFTLLPDSDFVLKAGPAN